MKSADIIEVFTSSVEETIFKKWRHEGFIGGFTSCDANFVIDGKEYVLQLREVADGEHWSERKDGDGMDEYIEMKALREAFDNADADVVEEYEDGGSDWGFSRQNILEVINSVPAADVAPVRHGRWDSSGKYRFQKDNSVAVRCTECGCSLTEPEYRSCVWNYCPVCGAKMDLEV